MRDTLRDTLRDILRDILGNTLSNILGNILDNILSAILSVILSITLGIMISDKPHYENDVPSNWAVCRLEDITVIGTGATPDTRIDAYYNGNIPWINSSSTKGEYIEIPSSYISEKAISETNCQIYPSGSLIMAMYGEGKTRGQVSELCFDSATNQACAAIVPIDNQMKGFLKAYLKSNYYHIRTLAEGGNQPNLNLSKISQNIIPIPPIDEQVRIIAAIEKWFALIETLETAKDDLQTSIVQAKSKILDLAIHGKLVPQNPNDEPAIELLKRINPKFTPCDNAHYENEPSNWAVCKVKDVFRINPKTKADDGMEAGFVPMSNIQDSYNNNFSYELRTWGNIKKGYTHFEDGDIVVAKISPCLENRKSAVIVGLPNGIGAGTTELNVFRSDYVYPLYGLFFFKSDYFISQCVGTFNGVVGQQRVSTKIIEDMVFPVPPRPEQERIINKVNELFQILDNISAEL